MTLGRSDVTDSIQALEPPGLDATRQSCALDTTDDLRMQ